MVASGFQFMQGVIDETGALLAEKEFTDFRPLAEDVVFTAVLDGRLPNDGKWGAATIVPLFNKEKLAGIRVQRSGCEKSYGLQIFADHALDILLAAELLDADEDPQQKKKLTWEVRVRACDREPQKKRLTATLAYAPFPVTDGTLSGLGIDAAGRQPDVWISAPLLAELRGSAAANLGCERAHFLAGRVVTEHGKPAVVLSDGFPAEIATGSSATHFGFSPGTFAAASREAQRRNDGLAILGWAHNHPPSCRRDCLAVVPPCKSENLFFSGPDRAVHRAGFSAPYAVALVAGKAAGRRADDPEIRAYGWRDGVIVEKSFCSFGG
jgi:hypothetical protein